MHKFCILFCISDDLRPMYYNLEREQSKQAVKTGLKQRPTE